MFAHTAWTIYYIYIIRYSYDLRLEKWYISATLLFVYNCLFGAGGQKKVVFNAYIGIKRTKKEPKGVLQSTLPLRSE